jgi:hypothetical protein
VKASLAILPLAFAASGCATSKPSPLDDLRPTPPELLTVEKECGLQSPIFRYTADGSVLMMPDGQEKYEAVDCVMAALKRPELAKYVSKLGFIGNEAYAQEEQK